MITSELLAYVASERSAGKSDTDIRQALVTGGGWSHNDLDEMFSRKVIKPSIKSLLIIFLGTTVALALYNAYACFGSYSSAAAYNMSIDAYQTWCTSQITGIVMWSPIHALVPSFILWIIYTRSALPVGASRKSVFLRAIKPTIMKVVATILIGAVSYFTMMLAIGFAFAGISHPLLGIPLLTLFKIINLPLDILSVLTDHRLNVFENSAQPYISIAILIVWFYSITCLFSYIRLCKQERLKA